MSKTSIQARWPAVTEGLTEACTEEQLSHCQCSAEASSVVNHMC